MLRISKRGQLVRVARIAIASALILAACTPATPQGTTPGGAPRRGGTLVIAFTDDPEILDPHVTTALRASRVLAMLHDSLVNRDYDGSFKPGLAERWEVSPDGKVYTFTLRTGVKFHSGKTLTSDDVKYTFDRWLGNAKSPTAFSIRPIDRVEAPDPRTVKFTLKDAYNIFLDQIAGAWAVILNKESVEKAGADYGVKTVDGTGPFKFVSWTRNQKLTLARNEEYTWGSPMFSNAGPAYVDSVEIRIVPEDSTRIAELLSGNIHLVADVPAADVERLGKTPGVSIVKYDQLQTTYMGFNTKKAPLDDVRVRRAINLAINRDEIVTGAYFGLAKPARTMLMPDTVYFSKSVLESAPRFDLKQAAALLDEAGWKPGAGGIREKDGKQLVVPFWVIQSSTNALQAQILEQHLAKAGIKLDTKQFEESAWFAQARSGEQVAFTVGVFYENADVLYFYFYSKQQPAPNRFSYAVPEVDQWLNDARSNPTQSVVQRDYDGAQKRISDDAPSAPLVHLLGTLGKTDAVQGVRVHASRWLYRTTDVWLSK